MSEKQYNMLNDKDIREQTDIINEKLRGIKIPEAIPANELILRARASKRKRNKSIILTGVVAAAIMIISTVGIIYLSKNHSVEHSAYTTTGNSGLVTASSEQNLYKYINSLKKNISYLLEDSENEYGGNGQMNDLTDGSAGIGLPESGNTGDGDFTTTNLRDEKVDEADIVKNDGQYIYTARNNNVIITKADNGNLTIVSTITLDSESTKVTGMFLEGDKLIIIRSSNSQQYTYINTYDITDKSNPKQLGDVSQQGSCYESRYIDGYVYIITKWYIEDISDGECIPKIDEQKMEVSDIYLGSAKCAKVYTIVTSIAIDNSDTVYSKKAVLGGGNVIYQSENNMYIVSTDYQSYYYGAVDDDENSVIDMIDNIKNGNEQNSFSTICRLSIDDGEINGGAQTKLIGYLDDSTGIDEYNGYLRIFTTDSTNILYILDMDLKQVGVIEDIAKGETVKSSSFQGDTAYVVTFLQTDPVFTIDLSDVKNPKVTGQLKIPGYSSYLFNWSDNRLLGMGQDANNRTQLSMFDTTDTSNLNRKYQISYKNSWATDIEYRTVFVEPENGLIGIATYIDAESLDENDIEEYEIYLIYRYDDATGFKLITSTYTKNSEYGYMNMRGLRIGQYFYVADTAGRITSYSISEDFKLIEQLDF